MIHPSAIVDPRARLGAGVSVGPWSLIGAEVEIGDGTSIGAHVVLEGPTRIGRDNRIHPFCSIGGVPQDKKFSGERSELEIGDRNTIREYCTFHRGTAGGGGITRVGSDNWIMAYVHVAHDCRVGDHTVMANAASLAGHVRLGDYATLGAFTVVHQFCAIGPYSFSAMGSVVVKDVPPFVTVAGNFAHAHGLNAEGLRRHGFSAQRIRALRAAYKTLYKRGLGLEEALAALEESAAASADVRLLTEFVRGSGRGIVR